MARAPEVFSINPAAAEAGGKPRARAAVTVRSMVSGSPAWKPQATFTEVRKGRSASSWPIDQAPKLSPTSAFRSMGPVMAKERTLGVPGAC